MTQPQPNEDAPQDLENGQISAEQQRFLAELNGMEQQAEAEQEELENFDPEAEQEAQKEAETNAEVAKMTAWGGVGMIEFALKQAIHPDFTFTAETKAYAVENMAPLLIKYGALLPDWVMQYEEEINAAKAAARMISEGMSTAKALKALPVDSEPEPETEGQTGEQHDV